MITVMLSDSYYGDAYVASDDKVHRKEIGAMDSSPDELYSLLHIMSDFTQHLFMHHTPETLENKWLRKRCH